VLAGALALSACGSNRDGGDGGLSGTIQADGSSTVFPLTEAVAEEFKVENQGVDITVGESGTGGGFQKFCNGETDMNNASRPIKREEARVCEKNGIEYTQLHVASDGLAIVVHPENDWVDCMTVQELNRIWEPGSAVKNWSQVRNGFPDQALRLYGPGTASGTFDYFTEAINGEEDASRNDYTQSEDDHVLVTGVAGDRGALGYFGYAYYAENENKLKVLGVDAGDGCVVPSDETVRDGTYTPLARPLFLYVRHDAFERPEVEAFVEFYLDSVNDLAAEVGYTPPSEETLAEARAAVEAIGS